MSFYDLKEQTINGQRKGVLIEWESMRVIVACIRGKTNELHIRGATSEDREAIQDFINRCRTPFLVTKGQEQFIEFLGTYLTARYTVTGSNVNTATFDSASKALKFATANEAQITEIVVYPDVSN